MYEENDLNPSYREDNAANASGVNDNMKNNYIDVNEFREVRSQDQPYTASHTTHYSEQGVGYSQQQGPSGYQMPLGSYQTPSYNTGQAQTAQKKNKSSFTKFIAGLAVVSLVGGSAIGGSFAFIAPYAEDYYSAAHENNNTSSSGQDIQLGVSTAANNSSRVLPLATNNSIADIAGNIGPSVVSIKNNQVVATQFGDYDQSGLGSGVIFKEDDKKVYIVSNAHVVEGANSLVVNFLGNTKVEAELVGADTITDLAVVAVKKEAIPAETMKSIKVAPLGNSDNLKVGELAVAIGNPVDEAYNNTVTVGVISALNREVQLTDRKQKLIQTDAAINPGNSGGALVGPTGEVIGINSIKLVDSKIEGMGFAIPINDAKPIIAGILQNGKISRPALGIIGLDVDAQSSELYEIPIGVFIQNVTAGSSAELAGIKANDILIQFNGTQITNMNQLKELLSSKKVGDIIEIKIIRGKSKKTLQVKLREMPKTVYNPQ